MNIKAVLLKVIRNGLGLIIVFFDWLSRPKAVQRSNTDQEKAQNSVSGLSLYQFFACPFCVKTRRAIHALNIDIESRDINENTEYRQELKEKGGKVTVPCLRIEDGDTVRWMYESNDIIKFLESRIANA